MSFTLKQIDKRASNMSVSLNRIQASWPKVSQVIYPKQTIRMNTGWVTSEFSQNHALHLYPTPQLISNNILMQPYVYNASNIGQQIAMPVTNQNNFPVKIQFDVKQNGDQTFHLLRLNHQLFAQQLLGMFDSVLLGCLGPSYWGLSALGFL